MKMTKSKGPNTLPCGTPESTLQRVTNSDALKTLLQVLPQPQPEVASDTDRVQFLKKAIMRH